MGAMARDSGVRCAPMWRWLAQTANAAGGCGWERPRANVSGSRRPLGHRGDLRACSGKACAGADARTVGRLVEGRCCWMMSCVAVRALLCVLAGVLPCLNPSRALPWRASASLAAQLLAFSADAALDACAPAPHSLRQESASARISGKERFEGAPACLK